MSRRRNEWSDAMYPLISVSDMTVKVSGEARVTSVGSDVFASGGFWHFPTMPLIF